MKPFSGCTQRLSSITTHEVDVLRLDLIDPVTGGNKHFKLKYNVEAAQKKASVIITFGGPHSNHIAATAAACAGTGIKACAIIRAHPEQCTPTLRYARSLGMELYFAGRSSYPHTKEIVAQLKQEIGAVYEIPEGGSNEEGMRGCREILPADAGYDYVILACGSGTTFAGMLSAATGRTVFIGISPLKGPNVLPVQATQMLAKIGSGKNVAGNEELKKPVIDRHCILSSFAGSGFGRFDEEIVTFRRDFVQQTGILLDYIYLPKVFFGLQALCAAGKMPHGSRILVVHSGGTQGNAGFEERYADRLAAIRAR